MKNQDTATKLTPEQELQEKMAQIDAILAESKQLSAELRGTQNKDATRRVAKKPVVDTKPATTTSTTDVDEAETMSTPKKKKVTPKVPEHTEKEENNPMTNNTTIPEQKKDTPKASKPLEENDTVKVNEIPEEDADNNETDSETNGFADGFKKLLSLVGVVALVGIFIMLILMYAGKECNSGSPAGVVGDTTVEESETDINVPGISTPDTNAPDTNAPETDAPNVDVPDTNEPDTDISVTPINPEFDMDAFVASVTKIAKQYTDNEDIGIYADVSCNKIGKNKLVELINEYDELTVQNGIATILAFVPEAKMRQYILKNGLDYNPNAVVEYSTKLQVLDNAYRDATGKNPDGALMSLPGYDSYNGNRDALRAMIIESGDNDLLTWYNAKMEIYDTMRSQTKDTDAANAYKKTVEAEILNSNGIAKLLECQLKSVKNGMIVVDNSSMQYTDEYYTFVCNYYILVVAE